MMEMHISRKSKNKIIVTHMLYNFMQINTN